MIAVDRLKRQAVTELLARGANPNLKADDGASAVSLAVENYRDAPDIMFAVFKGGRGSQHAAPGCRTSNNAIHERSELRVHTAYEGHSELTWTLEPTLTIRLLLMHRPPVTGTLSGASSNLAQNMTTRKPLAHR